MEINNKWEEEFNNLFVEEDKSSLTPGIEFWASDKPHFVKDIKSFIISLFQSK